MALLDFYLKIAQTISEGELLLEFSSFCVFLNDFMYMYVA